MNWEYGTEVEHLFKMRDEDNGKRRVGRKEMMIGNGGEDKEEGGRKEERETVCQLRKRMQRI